MGLELLGTGAGAGQGLQELIANQRADEMMRQQALEKAMSAIGLQQNQQARLAQTKTANDALAESRSQNTKARMSDVNLRQLQALAPGTQLGQSSFDRLTNPETGATPPESFDASQGTPASLPSTSLSGLQPLDRGQAGSSQMTAQPSQAIDPSYRFKGTAQQQEKSAAQDSLDASRGAAIDAKVQALGQAASRLEMQGHVNEANILRAQAEAELAHSRANAADKKGNTINLSQAGKSAKAAIEQAGPLTDQVLNMIRKEAPDIESNPDKYNTPLSKLQALYQKGKYKLGIYDDTDPRQQLVSLLQPIQAGQYTRSSRSRQMLELALKHMADPSQTLLTQYQRAKELKSIMPEMLEGIVRGEQPVDASNPLGGSYFDPAKSAPASTTPNNDPLGIRR